MRWRNRSRAELFDRTLRDQLAAVNDADVRTQALDDFEHVRGEEDGDAARDHALQHRFQSAGGDGVDAFEGLVEEEDARPVDDGGGERELLLHAVGEVGDQLLVLAGEVHEVEQLGCSLVCGHAIQAVHAADEAEVLAGGEAAEQGHALGDDPDLALQLGGVLGQVGAQYADLAAGGCEQAGEHLDGGGLAGAVGAEEAEELARVDGEVDVIDGGEIPEAARERGGLDGGRHVGIIVAGSGQLSVLRCQTPYPPGGWVVCGVKYLVCLEIRKVPSVKAITTLANQRAASS